MNDLLQRVANTVQQRHLLTRGQKILVAVSGGVDSMVLLHSLHSLAGTHRWKITVAHFNHRLRGRASNADAKLVSKLAAALHLKFLSGEGDVKRIAAQSKLSIEMAARKLRHEFLARTAREQRISTIALAHHADDQVELFFLRMFRGTGGEGLAGMKWRSTSPADKTITLVRPLLDFSKADLLTYARENKIRFRDDATNFLNDFLRNRVRNELLPLLRKKYQPGVDKTVLRLMEIAGAESEFVSDVARSFADSGWYEKAGQTASVPPANPTFDDLPLAIRRKMLRQQLTDLGLVADFELIEQLRKAPDREVSVGVGLTVLCDAGGNVRCKEHISSEFKTGQLNINLSGGQGRAVFSGYNFHWQLKPMKQFALPAKKLVGGQPARRECFDADKIGDEIVLRHWQPGDRFQPIGLKSAIKLQDLFVNAKIPAARRRELVLATSKSGEIFWVQGLRIGEQFKLTPQTRRTLVWQL